MSRLLEDPEYLIALAAGDGWSTADARYHGVPIRVVAALRPDGQTMVTAETTPASGRAHTEFWLLATGCAKEAVEHAIRESRRLLDALETDAALNAATPS